MPTPAGWGFIALIPFSFFLALRILKRMNVGGSPSLKLGCFSLGWIALVAYFVGLFTFGLLSMLISSTYEKYDSLVNREDYTAYSATTIDVVERDYEESIYYSYVLQITTRDGATKMIKEGYTSSSPDQLGKTVEIFYNEKNGRLFKLSDNTLSASFICLTIGGLLVLTVLLFVFVGGILYAAGCKMKRFWSVANSFTMIIFIPFLMLAFDALLVYGLFYGNEIPWWASAVLVFFTFVLLLSTWGYLKMLILEGVPKWRRESENTWSADWEDGMEGMEDEDDKPDAGMVEDEQGEGASDGVEDETDMDDETDEFDPEGETKQGNRDLNRGGYNRNEGGYNKS